LESGIKAFKKREKKRKFDSIYHAILKRRRRRKFKKSLRQTNKLEIKENSPFFIFYLLFLFFIFFPFNHSTNQNL